MVFNIRLISIMAFHLVTLNGTVGAVCLVQLKCACRGVVYACMCPFTLATIALITSQPKGDPEQSCFNTINYNNIIILYSSIYACQHYSISIPCLIFMVIIDVATSFS